MNPKFLSLRNFKSIGNNPQKIELAPITLLFGPNSAGKSTVLQSLIYLREALIQKNYDPDKTDVGGEWLDLGGFANLVHGRDLANAIELSIGFEIEGDQLPDYLSEYERNELEIAGFELPEVWLEEVHEIAISISVRWSEGLNRPYTDRYESWIDGQRIACITSTADCKQVLLEELNTSHPVFSLEDHSTGEDVGDFETRLSEVFGNVRVQARDPVEDILAKPRPFKTWKIDALESLFDGGASLNIKLFDKIREELSNRSSRRAAELLDRISQTTVGDVEREMMRHLTLAELADAMPDKNLGLKFSDLLWNTDTDKGEDEPAFQRLTHYNRHPKILDKYSKINFNPHP